MVPPDQHGDQVLTEFAMDVRGTSGLLLVDWQTDRFANRVCRVAAEHVESAVDFEACFRVQRVPHLSAPPVDLAIAGALTRFTPLTYANERIRQAARTIAQRSSVVEERVQLAHEWTASSISYEVGVTSTQTPAAMALHLGQGVCQDYAHIMLSVLRALGIAGRYVSGHLLGEGAPHAWVEALVMTHETGEVRAVGCDPTHRCDIGPDYIVVATGRDFADVTSTSGVFTGAALGKLHWSKYASRIDEAVDSAA